MALVLAHMAWQGYDAAAKKEDLPGFNGMQCTGQKHKDRAGKECDNCDDADIAKGIEPGKQYSDINPVQ